MVIRASKNCRIGQLNQLNQRGFSLLEILVAFSIFSLSIATLLQVYSTGMRSARLAQQYSEATHLAQSILAGVGTEYNLEEGEQQGQSKEDGYQWRLIIAPFVLEERLQNGLEMNHPALYHIQIEVHWGSAVTSRRVVLTSLRLGL